MYNGTEVLRLCIHVYTVGFTQLSETYKAGIERMRKNVRLITFNTMSYCYMRFRYA